MIELLDSLVFIFGVLGAIFVGQKNRLGFIFFIIHSICAIIIGILATYWGLVSTSLIFIIIDGYYFIQWGKDEEVS